MFELRNETEVWYKSEDMYDWIQYGHLFVVQPTETENIFKVTKFNFDTQQYEITNELDTFNYLNKDYPVVNGFFEYIPDPEPTPEPTQMDTIQQNQLIIMEALAEQYENSLN